MESGGATADPGESRPNGFQRIVQEAAATAAASKLLAIVLHRIDGVVLRATRGRATATSLLTGLPIVLLTTTGARTGRLRSVPLVGIPIGDDVLVVASNFGARRHPAWRHNLRADPRAMVSLKGQSVRVLAREAGPSERGWYWSLALRHYAGFQAYARRASGREIPLVILHPLGGAEADEAARLAAG